METVSKFLCFLSLSLLISLSLPLLSSNSFSSLPLHLSKPSLMAGNALPFVVYTSYIISIAGLSTPESLGFCCQESKSSKVFACLRRSPEISPRNTTHSPIFVTKAFLFCRPPRLTILAVDPADVFVLMRAFFGFKSLRHKFRDPPTVFLCQLRETTQYQKTVCTKICTFESADASLSVAVNVAAVTDDNADVIEMFHPLTHSQPEISSHIITRGLTGEIKTFLPRRLYTPPLLLIAVAPAAFIVPGRWYGFKIWCHEFRDTHTFSSCQLRGTVQEMGFGLNGHLSIKRKFFPSRRLISRTLTQPLKNQQLISLMRVHLQFLTHAMGEWGLLHACPASTGCVMTRDSKCVRENYLKAQVFLDTLDVFSGLEKVS